MHAGGTRAPRLVGLGRAEETLELRRVFAAGMGFDSAGYIYAPGLQEVCGGLEVGGSEAAGEDEAGAAGEFEKDGAALSPIEA